ncbi:MAG TPA: adenylate/guanylate cyclase domain-containing protein [Gemmatimonadota bacterium]|nr:adenylate/guanylate cyclase domain-containing protein [Gemmatimonadota bacterium]
MTESAEARSLPEVRLEMDDRARRRAEWRLTWGIAAGVAAVSFVFGWFVDSNGWRGGLQGIVNSLLISIPVSRIELAGRRWRLLRAVRDWPFLAVFVAKIVLYVVLIVAATELTRLLMQPLNPQPLGFDPIFFRILVFASIMSLLVNAVIEVGQLLGFGVLRDLVTGRYHRPRREERVFLLIDMKSSTVLAERLDDLAYHRLLNRFFRDVTDAALDHGASVHKYVGDEAILTWRAEDALTQARCVLCAFAVRKRILSKAAEYEERFDVVPEYRAALHIGTVVAGEMGDLKREIAFVGDTLNTAARLLVAGRELGRDIIASTTLLDRLALPADMSREPLAPLALRGKEQTVPVAALHPA